MHTSTINEIEPEKTALFWLLFNQRFRADCVFGGSGSEVSSRSGSEPLLLIHFGFFYGLPGCTGMHSN